jgi:hypothetical protein
MIKRGDQEEINPLFNFNICQCRGKLRRWKKAQAHKFVRACTLALCTVARRPISRPPNCCCGEEYHVVHIKLCSFESDQINERSSWSNLLFGGLVVLLFFSWWPNFRFRRPVFLPGPFNSACLPRPSRRTTGMYCVKERQDRPCLWK